VKREWREGMRGGSVVKSREEGRVGRGGEGEKRERETRGMEGWVVARGGGEEGQGVKVWDEGEEGEDGGRQVW